MPRKPTPPPVVEQVVLNPDVDEGEKAFIETLNLLIDFILEDRTQENVDTTRVA
jgi:hypothetical protein